MTDTTNAFTILCTSQVAQGFAQWLIAIGTVGAVLVATLWPKIKEYRNRPKLNFSMAQKTPCIEVIGDEEDSSNSDKIIKINLILLNTGRRNASYPEVYVDSFYQKNGDIYVKEEFMPRSVKDFKGNKITTVVPNRKLLLGVAKIKNSVQNLQDESETTVKKSNSYGVYLAGDEKNTIGCGDFIVPVNVASARVYETAYVKIVWSKDSFDASQKNFLVELISKKDFKKIKTKEN